MSINPTGENPFDLPASGMVIGKFKIDNEEITLLENKGHEKEIDQICLAQQIGKPCGYCTVPFKNKADVTEAVWGGGDRGWVHPACYEKIKEIL